MAGKKVRSASEMLATIVTEGIFEKKGEDVVTIDLRKMHNAVADFFVVCHAGSRAQVEAIADSVQMEVKKAVGHNVWKKEGFENAEWVLLDYVDVVVHIFQETARKYYRLEDLWADAEIRLCKPAPPAKKKTKKNASAEEV
ncbi:ribosome silencing factor RsfS/YbeB/iojap [Lentimicrobium saccharophilum]|uniref:Ribosomal silencing factor RsfS n=1 Tax=Lentimicrobium saccharophilum TaxID=1678841 RepID=A0A0S7BY22_9BACT|nr:ribosome silencing factor [Lentimicrobium saccharophilum]GAP42529.1 ribosome silencing factor RsfS/YbeB/iojap [Lentimicrobium saccharophilum]